MTLHPQGDQTVALKRGIGVTFHSVSAWTVQANTRRLILDACSGHIRAGSLCGILGSSGGGKTSLLQVLSNQNVGTHVEGEVLMNGMRKSAAWYSKKTAFVPQTSVLLSALTPLETLNFASRIRLPENTADDEHTQNVERVINALGLTRCANTRIGDELTGSISGGEKRRVNVATEMVAKPELLLADEVTTGCDSLSALALMRALKSMTKSGESSTHSNDPASTVITTLHQPPAELFAMLDDLILMNAGCICYCGPASEALIYFAKLDYVCPPQFNVPEYLLDLLVRTNSEDNARLAHLVDAYDRHVHEQQVFDVKWRPKRRATIINNSEIIEEVVEQVDSKTDLSYCFQLKQLIRRASLCATRSPLLKIASVMQSIVLGMLTGLAYLKFGNGQDSVLNRMGACYFITLTILFANIFAVVLTFAEERAVFMREQKNKLYSVSAYFFSKTIVDVPTMLLCAFVFTLIAYFLSGFMVTFSQFFFFAVIIALVALCGQGMGLLISAGIGNRLLAMLCTPISVAPFILFTAFSLPFPDSAPAWYLPWKYSSPFWFAFSALVANQFPTLTFTCDDSEKVQLPPISGLVFPPFCPFRRGVDILDQFGISATAHSQGLRVLALIIQALVFRLLSLFLLKRMSKTSVASIKH